MKNKILKYPPEFKAEVCAYARDSGVRNAAKLYSVNKETVSKWTRISKNNYARDNCEQTEVQEDEDLYIFFHVLMHSVRNKEEYILYQFNITNRSKSINSVGFTASRSNTSICIFLDYVLSTLKELNKFNIKRIKTNIPYLAQSGKYNTFEETVEKKFGVDLKIIDSTRIPSHDLRVELYHRPRTKELFKHAYRKLISESEAESLSNGIIIPPIFIDEFLQDYNKIVSFSNYWTILNLPQKQSSILFEVMNEVEKMADAAKIDFEFDKAMDFYHRLYLTSLNCTNSDELQSKTLLKQAEIHYHLDSFKTSTVLLEDCILLSDKNKYLEKAAKAQYYLGMINYILSNTEKADNFFSMAIENYEKTDQEYFSFDYYQARIRKNMNLNKCGEALEIVNEFIQRAILQKDKENLSKGYGIKGSIFYLQQMYDKAEKNYLKQYNIAKENNDYNELSMSLSNQLNLYSYQNSKDHQFLNTLIEEMKNISKITKKNNFVAEANYRLGIFYYKNKDYLNAEKYLFNAFLGQRKLLFSSQYFSTMQFLGRIYCLQRKYIKASKIFRLLLKDSQGCSNNNYLMYGHLNLGKIFYDMRSFRNSLKHYNITVKISMKLENNLFVADSYKHIGLIHSQNPKYKHLAVSDFNNAKKYYQIFKQEDIRNTISDEINFIDQKLSDL